MADARFTINDLKETAAEISEITDILSRAIGLLEENRVSYSIPVNYSAGALGSDSQRGGLHYLRSFAEDALKKAKQEAMDRKRKRN